LLLFIHNVRFFHVFFQLPSAPESLPRAKHEAESPAGAERLKLNRSINGADHNCNSSVARELTVAERTFLNS
jgi:hypothetical protein